MPLLTICQLYCMNCMIKKCLYKFYRYLAHNGEINTLRGNRNLMKAREGVMHSDKFGEKLNLLYPVVERAQSDSGCVDNVLEFLCRAGGRELPEVCISTVVYYVHMILTLHGI